MLELQKNLEMFFWVAAWFVIVICVTTLNKTFFTKIHCPYPVSITMVALFTEHSS